LYKGKNSLIAIKIFVGVVVQLPQRLILQIGEYIYLAYFPISHPGQVPQPHQQLRLQALAREIDLPRSNLYKKIESFGIIIPEHREADEESPSS